MSSSRSKQPFSSTMANEREKSPAPAPPPPPTTVYVLVHTSDREDVPVPHYECGGESTVIGVYSCWRLAEKAKRIATAGMEQGSNEDDYHDGSSFISTFSIFPEVVQNYVDGTSDEEDDCDDEDDDSDDEDDECAVKCGVAKDRQDTAKVAGSWK